MHIERRKAFLAARAYEAGRSGTAYVGQADGARMGLARLAREAEQCLNEWKQIDPPKNTISCRNGCYFCCHMRVTVTPLEVFAVANYVQERFGSEEYALIVERVRKAASKSSGLDDDKYGTAGIWCPLLVNGSCSVYSARPLECRGYASMDVTACRNTILNYLGWDVPIYIPQYMIYKYAQAASLQAQRSKDLTADLLEFNQALLIALTEQSAESRWMKGNNVFATARLPVDDEEVKSLEPWTATSWCDVT